MRYEGRPSDRARDRWAQVLRHSCMTAPAAFSALRSASRSWARFGCWVECHLPSNYMKVAGREFSGTCVLEGRLAKDVLALWYGGDG
jgi:hypothetical protein